MHQSFFGNYFFGMLETLFHITSILYNFLFQVGCMTDQQKILVVTLFFDCGATLFDPGTGQLDSWDIYILIVKYILLGACHEP
jgi:hypothetical protein